MNDLPAKRLYIAQNLLTNMNMKQIKASIITIGDELLIGQVIDTNSAWMAREMNQYGIAVKRRVAVGDIWDDIWNAMDEESNHCDIILITGGLGPTADDITKPLLCKYFNGRMAIHEEALKNVTHIFENILRKPLTERNRKQAEIPDNCTMLLNKRGTAPGMWFEKDGKIFVSLPGVPHEMKGLMADSVIPSLLQHFQFPHLSHRTLLTAGIGESTLADMIMEFEESLPEHIKLAYLPNDGMVRLRLSTVSNDKDAAEKELDQRFSQLQEQVKEFLVTNKDEKMEELVGRLLHERKETVCTAESCTGGYIAHLISSIPGASAYYEGSVVSYSYAAKENLLHVDEQTLIDKGAVSEEVVRQMAHGALEQLKTTYAIAVSGIMGPDGSTPEKPVGTVWIAAGKQGKIITKMFHFRYDRARNIQLTAVNALNVLRQLILNNNADDV